LIAAILRERLGVGGVNGERSLLEVITYIVVTSLALMALSAGRTFPPKGRCLRDRWRSRARAMAQRQRGSGKISVSDGTYDLIVQEFIY
jgi:hypothetical protein